ncbi:MAG: hypothetical protein AVDCRST_MAG67-4327, partial [uncultured Solirubrobacteraceae bacterium]
CTASGAHLASCSSTHRRSARVPHDVFRRAARQLCMRTGRSWRHV